MLHLTHPVRVNLRVLRLEVLHRERAEGTKAGRIGPLTCRRRFDRRFEVLQCRSGPPQLARKDSESVELGTHGLLALPIDVLERVLPSSLGFEALIVLVQLQGRPSVFDRIVSIGLNVRVQDSVGEEAQ